ncbi:MAG: S9 family peptidase [Planctomycetota bacterium]
MQIDVSRVITSLGVAALGLAAFPNDAVARQATSIDDVPLISRDVLFGNPERAGVQLSPDGQYISFRAPVNDVMNVWVAPIDAPNDAAPITNDTDRGVRRYFWAENGTHLIYLQDRGGDENWRAYSVDIETRNETDLTPFEGVQARIAATDKDYPNDILIEINQRDPQFHDVFKVDVRSGNSELVFENTGYAGTVIDNDMKIRLGATMGDDGSMTYKKLYGSDAGSELMAIPANDAMTSGIGGFIGDSSRVYMLDSSGRDTGALYTMDIETGERTLVYADERVDIGSAITNPITDEIEGVILNYDKPERIFMDAEVEADYRRLERVRGGEVNISDRSRDDRTWLVAYTRDDGPVEYVVYNRDSKEANYLFSNQPALEDLPLSPMHPVVIKSRDGMDLVSYLTLPAWTDADGDARPDAAVPMVLLVHGGPWGRDSWGFNPYHQWLANRGYAVLSVNFRASTGFGKSFIAAGNGAWADGMHHDLIDAVNWAVAEGIADEDRVAIMGGSYGGYATLAGLTFSPDVFACGVDIVGPSNLITLLNSIPSYWEPIIGMFTTRVADHRTPEGRRKLRDMSPLTHVDEITKPLLIGQGANDPRVKIAESDQIVDAMNARSIPVTYIVFPDEGHGFAKPENNKAFNAITEAFLAKHIGGRYQPIADSVTASTAQVRDFGDLEINGAELYVPNPEAEAAAASKFDRVVTYDDLNAEEQAAADQALTQLKQIPDEMIPMVLTQMESQEAMVPEEELNVYLFLKAKLMERLDATDG